MRQTEMASRKYDPQKLSPRVGTEIFSRTLPSELTFEHPPSKEAESTAPNSPSPSPIDKFQLTLTSRYETLTKCINNYSFRHSSPIETAEEYPLGSLISSGIRLDTFAVKLYDQNNELLGVPTWRAIWSSVVGYNSAELHIKDGLIYVLQRSRQGLLVSAIWKLATLFKLFMDNQEKKLRLIFLERGDTMITREMKVERQDLLQLLLDQISKANITCLKS